ncbi:hypothetical protein [Novosphingobium panipatense]|uniref:Secreted protein n=1 Tax=Novosphingobium panipatense TaxID=428991 RepID=A0ABY1QQB1_9SPHN|nr:hypothetical protein [Novosphingobium panipatense]SMP78005.1 hypothetical protein SAMN06296065_11060 [Novosphingobium panipatense]
MAIVAPALFLVAAFAAIAAIWKSASNALPHIRLLREALAESSGKPAVYRTTLTTRDELSEEVEQRLRPRHRVARPVASARSRASAPTHRAA